MRRMWILQLDSNINICENRIKIYWNVYLDIFKMLIGGRRRSVPTGSLLSLRSQDGWQITLTNSIQNGARIM